MKFACFFASACFLLQAYPSSAKDNAGYKTDIDHVSDCLLSHKTFENQASAQKAKCFTDDEFEKISKAEPFLLLSSVYCPGGESKSAVKGDIFNEVAQREMEQGVDTQDVFAAFQREGSKLAHQVLNESVKSTIAPFCSKVLRLYGPRGTEFSGLYSLVGKHEK